MTDANGYATLGDELKVALRNLTIATVVLYLALVVVGVFAWVQADRQRDALAEVATNTNAALCSVRGDLEQRVQDSEDFLKEHPDGIPGISAATIEQSIANQQATVDALMTLDCGGKP